MRPVFSDILCSKERDAVRSAVQNAGKDKQAQKRIAVFALLLCFISVSFLSVFSIVIHAGHDCAGAADTECHACVKFYSAKKLLEQAGRTAASVFFAGTALLAFTVSAKLDTARIFPSTPFQCKVRLNT